MQNFRSMAAGSSGSGRIFAGDRRMWPHPNQALKCPRCDSLNTKFCYYNNYNLSQPRHFCKSCRRYWTKGGVLRNVPVGGGCRKTKRSKPKSLPDSQKDRKTTSPRHHAGSENSDLTAAATAATAAGEITATSASDLHHLGDFTLQNPKNLASSAMESLDPASNSDVFKAAGSFSGLTTVTNSGASLGFGFSNFSPSFRVYNNYNNNNNNNNNNNDNNYNNNKISSLVGLEEPKMPELPAGYLAQTVTGEIPAPQERQVIGGLTALGWHGNGEPGLFDMASVDQGYYWGQTQWGETDQSLFLP